MNKKIKNFVLFSAATITGMHIANRVINYTASLKNLTSSYSGNYYKWRYGNIFYTKSGSGDPILLIHDLDPSSSSYEWARLVKKLEKTNTVYTIDLLGCGHSDKPAMIYSNYLYVQLLNDFTKHVIKDNPFVVATGTSGSFTIMCAKMNENLFKKLIIINPESLKSLTYAPDKKGELIKKALECPIIGTFIYNMYVHEKNINNRFVNKYYYLRSLVSSKFEDIYFESAHIGNGSGRFLLSSILAHYTNINVAHAIKDLDNLCLVGSRNIPNNISNIDKYILYNKNIETAYISNAAYLPQLEVPDKLLDVIKMFMQS